MTVQITAVTPQDVTTLREVSCATFQDTFGSENSATDLQNYLNRAYSVDQLLTEINNPESWFYFIKVNQAVAGYLKLNVGEAQTEKMGSDALEIQRIYILPSFKRQGLGTQLFNQATANAEDLHKRAIWLGVWEHNDAARKFYHKIGFQPVGDHVFQLGSSVQRDLIMKRTL
ncbi:GNAT family N-acetyltransferase [Furfurilactobacillus rossiae]|uniref:Acetyltransferase n=1 Tax=Furfurilactobacillus rossiae DSM 15814 TaxID=1114972 RepID=A0A0R1RBH2_9LACO|nr:N-acetyltransferase [Furfurilactobacillus rossiae]KRL53790.1 acetyltransferase [Furfurilactobacillus rossiae DSM 15814]QFR66731.1 GNAT family N-acetyltransferase [Furfurilactobacillus rossiae]QLE62209.1 N-acetyltransferase GNAT [Furfurilactobacillus rossiae]